MDIVAEQFLGLAAGDDPLKAGNNAHIKVACPPHKKLPYAILTRYHLSHGFSFEA